MRAFLFFKPLAVVLAVLMMRPAIPLATAAMPAAAPRFVAPPPPSSSVVCTEKAIIKASCVNSAGNVVVTGTANGAVNGDLAQFEADTVTAYLKIHGLPASEASTIYDVG